MMNIWYGENIRIENALCENNLVEDLDDYQLPASWAPRENWGRELHVTGMDTLRMKNVIIRNSRQPNWCPEWVGDLLSQSRPGCVVFASSHDYSTIENILIEDCDDGGMYAFAHEGPVSNVIVRNVGRQGLYVNSNGSVTNLQISNVDVADDELQPQDADLFNQYALGLGSNPVLENVTISGCDGLRHPIKLDGGAQALFRNSLFWDNNSGPLAFTGSGGTVSWDHCLAQETLPGTGNLVADPRFDSQLGAPFLALESPCIDAGNPEPAYNDPEDPANPGFPLWPSLGNLRNDMGFTGGPHAALRDTTWSALPDWEPTARPGVFSLGAPYPNPFNPAIHIPFLLRRPAHVRLSVHNLLGQEVAVLVNAPLVAGRQDIVLDGAGLASGLYVVTLDVAGQRASRSITLLR